MIIVCHRRLTRDDRKAVHLESAKAGVQVASGIVKNVTHLCTPPGLEHDDDYAISEARARGLTVLAAPKIIETLRLLSRTGLVPTKGVLLEAGLEEEPAADSSGRTFADEPSEQDEPPMPLLSLVLPRHLAKVTPAETLAIFGIGLLPGPSFRVRMDVEDVGFDSSTSTSIELPPAEYEFHSESCLVFKLPQALPSLITGALAVGRTLFVAASNNGTDFSASLPLRFGADGHISDAVTGQRVAAEEKRQSEKQVALLSGQLASMTRALQTLHQSELRLRQRIGFASAPKQALTTGGGGGQHSGAGGAHHSTGGAWPSDSKALVPAEPSPAAALPEVRGEVVTVQYVSSMAELRITAALSAARGTTLWHCSLPKEHAHPHYRPCHRACRCVSCVSSSPPLSSTWAQRETRLPSFSCLACAASARSEMCSSDA